MGKLKSWNVDVLGETSKITIQFHSLTGNHKLIVNGTERKLNHTFKTKLTGLDQGIMINGKEIRLVITGNKGDLAIDGYYLDSKKEYTPLLDMPSWVWIFVIACLAIPFYTLGGAIPAVIGVCGAILCARVSVKPAIEVYLRVLLSLVITGLSWFVLLMFINLMLSIL